MQILADGSPLAHVNILHVKDKGRILITSVSVYLMPGTTVIMQLMCFLFCFSLSYLSLIVILLGLL